MTVVYIAGPMTGLPDYNYPAFHAAQHAIEAAGHTVLNPARRGTIPGWEWSDYLRAAITDLVQADEIALLDGWRHSRGAQLEIHIATRLGMPVKLAHCYTRPLKEASRGA